MTTMNTEPSEREPNWNVEASDALLSNWPLRDVLVALTHAATHLLTDHDCDAHGYEELQHAVVAARHHADLLDTQPDAATRMRERCVGRVKEVAEEWRREVSDPTRMIKYDAARALLTELQYVRLEANSVKDSEGNDKNGS